MSDPINEVYFISKAIAEIVGEKIEDNFTNVLSDFGKFDAETRERLQEFAQEVQARAKMSQENSGSTSDISNNTITVKADETVDTQELLDELRHEIARLKAQLTSYRQSK